MVPLKQIRKSFNRAAKTYEEYGTLQREVSGILVFSFLYPKASPPVNLLDIGSGVGFTSENAKKRWRKCAIFSLDISPAMAIETKRKVKTQCIIADGSRMPFKEKSFDMVLSSLVFHWTNYEEILKESYRVLKPKGILAFSTLLPGTLKELRSSYNMASIECTRKPAEFKEFIQVDTLENMLISSGFSALAFEKNRIIKRYKNVVDLLTSLKNTGVTLAGRPRNPPRRDVLESTIKSYPRIDCSEAVEATYELAYIFAMRP